MDTPQNDLPEESVTAEVVEGPPPEVRAASYVQAPKLMRIASMTRAMLDEVRQAPIDEPGRRRLAEAYDRSLAEMQDVLSEDLRQELVDIFTPISSETRHRVGAAHRPGPAGGLAGGPVRRHPGHAAAPAGGHGLAAAGDADAGHRSPASARRGATTARRGSTSDGAMPVNGESRGERFGRRLRTVPAVVVGFVLATALLPVLVVALLAYDAVRALRGRGRFSAVRLLLFGWVVPDGRDDRPHLHAALLAGERVREGARACT